MLARVLIDGPSELVFDYEVPAGMCVRVEENSAKTRRVAVLDAKQEADVMERLERRARMSANVRIARWP